MTDPLPEIDKRIAAAKAALDGARASCWKYPAGDNVIEMEKREATLNDLLDLRCAMARKRVTA